MRPLLVASCLLVLTACDDPFTVQAKAASVCQHLTNQRFVVPAGVREQLAQLPPEMVTGDYEVSRAFEFDVSTQLPPDFAAMLDANVKLTSVVIRAAEGSTDLGFISQAHLTLQPVADPTLEPRSFDYVRTDAAPREISWSGDAVDVGAYMQSGTLRYLVSLSGQLPEGDVVVDIDACAEADISVNYL